MPFHSHLYGMCILHKFYMNGQIETKRVTYTLGRFVEYY